MLVLYSIIGFLCMLGVFWGIWSSEYFLSSYNLQGVAQILPQDLAYLIFAMGLPIIFLLMVAILIFFLVSTYLNRDVMIALMKNSKASISGVQTLSKSLIEVRKLGFTNQFFETLPLVLSDITLCLSDIISKTGMASELVIFDALNKVGDMKLYSVCKVILDLRESTPHFDENLRRKAKKDSSVASAIQVFSYKYNKLLNVLKKYDLDGFIYNLMEEGYLGKVNNIFITSIEGFEIDESKDKNLENSMYKEDNIESLLVDSFLE